MDQAMHVSKLQRQSWGIFAAKQAGRREISGGGSVKSRKGGESCATEDDEISRRYIVAKGVNVAMRNCSYSTTVIADPTPGRRLHDHVWYQAIGRLIRIIRRIQRSRLIRRIQRGLTAVGGDDTVTCIYIPVC